MKIELPNALREAGFVTIDQLSQMLRRTFMQSESAAEFAAIRHLATEILEQLAVLVATHDNPNGAASIQVSVQQLNACIDQALSIKAMNEAG